ncbi:hypothetical protein FACS189459_1220 [Bacilli bacterium]|nr:hypothetical protein FACS189459_1220 [Bacilli bacterium]
MYIVIKAKTEKEAYDKAKNCPRVKHDDPEFMLERPINISEQRYNEIKADNAKDPYFKATNSSECRYSDCLHQERIVEEPNYICDGKKKTKRNFFKKL